MKPYREAVVHFRQPSPAAKHQNRRARPSVSRPEHCAHGNSAMLSKSTLHSVEVVCPGSTLTMGSKPGCYSAEKSGRGPELGFNNAKGLCARAGRSFSAAAYRSHDVKLFLLLPGNVKSCLCDSRTRKPRRKMTELLICQRNLTVPLPASSASHFPLSPTLLL